jgi:hypothetical protein
MTGCCQVSADQFRTCDEQGEPGLHSGGRRCGRFAVAACPHVEYFGETSVFREGEDQW